MKRTIIKIDQTLCNGCSICVDRACPEGALQMIDGKAHIISEPFCDGLAACVGECPQGAINTEEREAQPYDEQMVMAHMLAKGQKTMTAHLTHLKQHQQIDYYNQALDYLKEQNKPLAKIQQTQDQQKAKASFGAQHSNLDTDSQNKSSQLNQWPVQLHLLNPTATFFCRANVLLAADCIAYSYSAFHQHFLRNKALAIACPKLDTNKETYVVKLKAMVDEAKINSLTVVMMEVPCCAGLLALAQRAIAQATRKIPIKKVLIGRKGNVLENESI